MPLISPALLLYAPAPVPEEPVSTPVFTPVNCVWLKVLKLSALNWKPEPSVS